MFNDRLARRRAPIGPDPSLTGPTPEAATIARAQCYRCSMFPVLLACAANDDNVTDTSDQASSPVVVGTMTEVPGGPYSMGCDSTSDPSCDGDELPLHTVTLSPYSIDVTEVTSANWEACVEAGACGLRVGVSTSPLAPVTGVTKEGAEGYCAWKEGRLPTEAEWEVAARGGDGRIYPWGSEAPDCDRAASRRCDSEVTEVGTHPAGVSPFGAHDMAGNAWEWVSDIYDAYYYATSPNTDPTGGDPGGLCVVRGVDSWSEDSSLRATNRTMVIPDAQSPLVGFRCVVPR